LGKPFASVGNDSKRFRLQEQRIQTIRELATRIEESDATFVIVSGDLFDFPHVTKATASAACSAIGSLRVPVIAISGNHNHGGPGSIWEQEFFLREKRQLALNFQVLQKPEPLGFAHRMSEQFTPRVIHEFDRSMQRVIHIHQQHSADADALHRLQISGDAFWRDVGVEPEPVDSWARRVGWPGKVFC
jgi:DNA repair exonuclease SbcCD nuclease subunit